MTDDLFPRQTRRSLPIALLRAREAVMQHFRPMLAAHDLSEQQWRVLRVLEERGEMDATRLAAAASLLGPSLTRMLATLEARGLIVRRTGADRRKVQVSSTPAAAAIIEEVLPDSRKVYAMIEERFGREKINALLDLLEELEAATGETLEMPFRSPWRSRRGD